MAKESLEERFRRRLPKLIKQGIIRVKSPLVSGDNLNLTHGFTKQDYIGTMTDDGQARKVLSRDYFIEKMMYGEGNKEVQ